MNKFSEIAIKIVLVGDEEVGKTSIIIKYVKNRFTEDYKPTLGADFAVKKLKFNEKKVKLYLWDIGGQKQFKNLHKYYYEGANLFLLVFDLTSYKTFENAINIWTEDIKNNYDTIPIILVGNKFDLENERQVLFEEIEKKSLNFINFSIETSAKTGHNIENLFLRILELLETIEIGP
ncbi:MAG: GTP-binding protein [Candidatus Helarchaeota archaeon]|nr:GTP-binding protein [Candidatus Helarchaeota archaeon]